MSVSLQSFRKRINRYASHPKISSKCLHRISSHIFIYQYETLLKQAEILKVAQVKDEMDVDEDDGCDGVSDVDVVWWCWVWWCVRCCA